MIKFGKIPKLPSLHDITMQAADLKQDIQAGLDRNFRVIQLDECMVTKKTLGKLAWTLPKTNVVLDSSETNMKALAILVSISREIGIELV